jgi:hypothetical protein
MHRLVKTFLLAALLNGRAALSQTMTQTVGPGAAPVTSVTMSTTSRPRLAPLPAPVGHRQPSVKDVVYDESGIEAIDGESAALDRKLRICRGC